MARGFREFREVREITEAERQLQRQRQIEDERRRQQERLEREERARRLEEQSRLRYEEDRRRFDALSPEAQRMEMLQKEIAQTERDISTQDSRISRLEKELVEKRVRLSETKSRHEEYIQDEAASYNGWGQNFYNTDRYRSLSESHQHMLDSQLSDIAKIEKEISDSVLALEAARITSKYQTAEMVELSRIEQMRKASELGPKQHVPGAPSVEEVHSTIVAQQAAEQIAALTQQQQLASAGLQKELEEMQKLQNDLANYQFQLNQASAKVHQFETERAGLPAKREAAIAQEFENFLPTINGQRPTSIQSALQMHSQYVSYNAHNNRAVDTREALVAKALVLNAVRNGEPLSQYNGPSNPDVYSRGYMGAVKRSMDSVRVGETISFRETEAYFGGGMHVQGIDRADGLFAIRYSQTNAHGSYNITNAPVNEVSKPLIDSVTRVKSEYEKIRKQLEDNIKEQKRSQEFYRGRIPDAEKRIADLQQVIAAKQAALDALQQKIDEQQAVIAAHEQGHIEAPSVEFKEFNEFDYLDMEKEVQEPTIESPEDYDDIVLKEEDLTFDEEEEDFDYAVFEKQPSEEKDLEFEEEDWDEIVKKIPNEPIVQEESYDDIVIEAPDVMDSIYQESDEAQTIAQDR